MNELMNDEFLFVFCRKAITYYDELFVVVYEAFDAFIIYAVICQRSIERFIIERTNVIPTIANLDVRFFHIAFLSVNSYFTS